MWKSLFKLLVTSVIWTRYRGIILMSLFLLIFIFMVTLIHTDYMHYVERAGQKDYIGISFLVKWGLIIGSVIAYGLYLKWLLRVKPSKSVNRNQEQKPEEQQNDPFAQLRKKKKLRSQAEIMIDKK